MTVQSSTLKQDVDHFYSSHEKTSKTTTQTYQFGDNTASITFERTWVGNVNCCGKNMTGSVKVTLRNRDSELEETIQKIIEGPSTYLMAGPSPIVSSITFNEK